MIDQDPHSQLPDIPLPPNSIPKEDMWRPPKPEADAFRESMGANPDKEPTQAMKEYGQAVMAAMELQDMEPNNTQDNQSPEENQPPEDNEPRVENQSPEEQLEAGTENRGSHDNTSSPEEQRKIQQELFNILRAVDGAQDSVSSNRTASQIVERSRKVLEGDLKLATYAIAMGASEDQMFIGDVFNKVLDPELKSLFGDNYPKVRKMVADVVKTHGDGVDPRVTRGDERKKLQNRSDLTGRIMQNVMSGNYSRVANLTESQDASLRSVLLGMATGVSPREQRRAVANQLTKSLIK